MHSSKDDLFDALESGYWDRVVDIFTDDPSRVHQRDYTCKTPLHIAAYDGDVRLARFVLDLSGDVNAEDVRGCTPLHLAAAEGRLEVVSLLLDAGARADAMDKRGRTALSWALPRGEKDAVVQLLRARGGPNQERPLVPPSVPKRRNKGGKRVVPQFGGESFGVVDLGEPRYHTPVGPAKSVVCPVPADAVAVTDAGEPHEAAQPILPNPALVPASEEVAKLPKLAREAFAARCAARIARLRPNATSPEAVAATLLAAATVETPIRRQLLCLRRDFDRLVFLAKTHNWTDDTPVPPETFGPMWPKNLIPDWAKEPPAPPPAKSGEPVGTS